MVYSRKGTKIISFLLALILFLGVLPMPSHASSIGNGSQTATIASVERHYFLQTTAGTNLGASAYQYVTNDGLTGPGYCIDHGLGYASKPLPITGKYTTSPSTAGAFANGYPQHSVETFLGLFLDENPILAGLTAVEFGYATQLAVWATLGQLAIEGTEYTSGRETVAQPVGGDAQKMRVFRSVQLILGAAALWDRIYQTGMYIRLQENVLGGDIVVPADMSLETAAEQSVWSIRREEIGGRVYFTREYIFASATSTYYSDYNIGVWMDNAPAGSKFVDTSNRDLSVGSFGGHSVWNVPTESKHTQINTNGYEYSGTAKLCIPADNVPDQGTITIRSGAYVMQYEIYLAENDIYTEQSYIIADPSQGEVTASATFSWSVVPKEKGSIQVVKVGDGGQALAGAKFTLTGPGGVSLEGTTDADGKIFWDELEPNETYTLTETQAPEGYELVDPVNIEVKEGETSSVTVQDTVKKKFIVKKVDAQTGYSLRGAVITFEQIDGGFRTSGTTDQAGVIQFTTDELPAGTYKVTETEAPEGYERDTAEQTVVWDGTKDVTLTFKDVRKHTLEIYKSDENGLRSLPGATFEVYREGQLITTVTTNDNGLAYVPDVTTGYYTVKEIVPPEGYELDSEEHSIYISSYDPAHSEDPRIEIRDKERPKLRILKYDAETGRKLSGATFEIYKDGRKLGDYTTNSVGEINLDNMEPGTYLVKEIATKEGYVVNDTPQEIELVPGKETYTLTFLNSAKPNIRLMKLDSETLQPLAGATFRVTQVGGNYTEEFVTGANGEAVLDKLEPGTYTIQETAAPNGYVPDEAQRTVQLSGGESVEFVFTNTKKPGLRLIKYDADFRQTLTGATFRISSIADAAHYVDRITDEHGEIFVEDLEPGVYSVQEIAAPAGYVLNETEFHVQLFPGQTSELVIPDQKKPDLTVYKKDGDTGEPLQGVTFQIRKADSSTVETADTDAEGKILIEGLEPGVYEVTEVALPEGYLPPAKESQMITLEAGKSGTVTFRNRKKPDLKIIKKDADTGELLPGTSFTLRKPDGETLTTVTTDDNGQALIEDLDAGTYEVVEAIPPTGYLAPEIEAQMVTLTPARTATVVFENYRKPTLTLKKISSVSGEPLAGVKFHIEYRSNNTETGEINDLGYYLTDENGQFKLEDLNDGWYTITETETIPGYNLPDPASQSVYIRGGEDAEVTFENTPLSALVIFKFDTVTGEAIPGAVFQVKKMSDTSGTGGTVIGTYTTGPSGSATVTGLREGTYIVEEIASDRAHVIDSAPQTVYVSGNTHAVVEVYFGNSPKGSVLIRKIDAITHEPLGGIKFLITDSDGAVIGSGNGYYTTDSAGTILISDIDPGTTIVADISWTMFRRRRACGQDKP